jgi:hypothetical protein
MAVGEDERGALMRSRHLEEGEAMSDFKSSFTITAITATVDKVNDGLQMLVRAEPKRQTTQTIPSGLPMRTSQTSLQVLGCC